MDIKGLIKRCWPVFLIFLPAILFAQVNQEWIVSYNGPSNREDCGYAIAVGSTENVYVAGYSYTVSPQFPHGLLIKYDSNGNEQWVFRHDSVSEFRGIVLDTAENVYVIGDVSSSAIPGEGSIITMKFDSSGNCLWNVNWISLSGGEVNQGRAIAIHGNEEIYILGTFYSPITDFDIVVNKYDNNGNELWSRQYDTDSMDDFGFDLVCDDAGNVYVTGRIQVLGIGDCYGTIKYDVNGNELWFRYYKGPIGGRARAIDIDSSRNIYITGENADTNTYDDYATIKYDTDGNELWVRRYNGPGNTHDKARALVVDNPGNVYVTGYSYGTSGDEDIATIKYDTDGNELWVIRVSGGVESYDQGQDITLDSSGNVYVAGGLDQDIGFAGYCTIKYDHDGNELWRVLPNDSTEGIPFAIALCNTDVHVTGMTYESSTLFDCTTVKYSQSPVGGFEERYSNVDNQISLKIAPNPFRQMTEISLPRLAERGRGWQPASLLRLHLVESGARPGIEDVGQGFPGSEQVSLAKVGTELDFGEPFDKLRAPSGVEVLSRAVPVHLKIYDASGRLVKDFSRSTPYALRPTQITWDGTDDSGCSLPAGVYFVRLETGGFKTTEKVILLK